MWNDVFVGKYLILLCLAAYDKKWHRCYSTKKIRLLYVAELMYPRERPIKRPYRFEIPLLLICQGGVEDPKGFANIPFFYVKCHRDSDRRITL